MNVSELIKILKKYPKDLKVAYRLHSEQVLMEECDIEVKELCEHRPDGWIENKRPDRPTKKYLMFPGN